MNLEESLENLKEVANILHCTSCGDAKYDIKTVSKAMDGITVTNLPILACEKCNRELYRANIDIAIERMQKEQNLHGAYTIEDLLDVDK